MECFSSKIYQLKQRNWSSVIYQLIMFRLRSLTGSPPATTWACSSPGHSGPGSSPVRRCSVDMMTITGTGRSRRYLSAVPTLLSTWRFSISRVQEYFILENGLYSSYVLSSSCLQSLLKIICFEGKRICSKKFCCNLTFSLQRNSPEEGWLWSQFSC